jgi:hypothetical protein
VSALSRAATNGETTGGGGGDRAGETTGGVAEAAAGGRGDRTNIDSEKSDPAMVARTEGKWRWEASTREAKTGEEKGAVGNVAVAARAAQAAARVIGPHTGGESGGGGSGDNAGTKAGGEEAGTEADGSCEGQLVHGKRGIPLTGRQEDFCSRQRAHFFNPGRSNTQQKPGSLVVCFAHLKQS